jgi:hypothetical protein
MDQGSGLAGTIPDFLCIGAQKAGTSWLNRVLLEHPCVFMPPINELHYFDRLHEVAPAPRTRQLKLARRAIREEEARGDSARPDYIAYLRQISGFPVADLDWYRACYAWPTPPGVKKGDITPAYLEIPEDHVRMARAVLGSARLILIVRRPRDRLLSQLRMWAGRACPPDHEPDDGEWMDLFRAMTSKTNRGSYRSGIPRWSEHFGADTLLILPYGEIRRDPAGLITRIEDHIGVPRYGGYSLLSEQVHVSRKRAIPKDVIAAAAEITGTEDSYIRDTFGDDFYARTA